MKKTLLLLASAAMLLVGCAKEKFSPEAGDAEMVNMTVSVLVQGEELTRAAVDEDGKGVNANRCIMVLYYGDQVYGRYTATVSNYKATFDVKVPAKRTYKAVFWADYATADGEGGFTDVYYNTDDLKNITLKSAYVGNNDKRDAFFKCEEYTVENKSQSFTATLTRPFAQINVISKDIKDLHLASLYPQKVNLSFKAATSFNAMSGECGAAGQITYEAGIYKAYDSTKDQLTLSMDYLFAGDRSTVDIDFKAPTEGTLKVEHNFSNIPYQRNYRTNIVGNLLTADAHWDVTINPEWNEPDEDVSYVEEGSVAAANNALAEGKTAILIQNPADAETSIVIPAVADGKNISIKTEGTNGKTLTFKGETGPANLYIASDAKELVINTQKTHVEVNSGAYTKVTAETSATTLVIAKGVTVETLDVNKGNVEIHGVVNVLNRKSGVKAEMYASDRATLVNYINWAKSGETVGLECDIDLSGENWTPAKLANTETIANFDGCGHSIKNMTVVLDASSSTPYGGGFYESVYSNGTMKNVTFENAEVKSNVDGKGNVFGIAAGYAYGNVTFENIKVKNSKVSAFGKVGGILGMAADPGTTVTTVKNCSLENVELIGTYNVANYIGLLQNNVALTGCTSTNVEKKLSVRYGEDSYVTFDNVKVINKDEQNPKYVLSSGKYWKYVDEDGTTYMAAFADYYNDMKYEGWKALNGVTDALVFNTPDTPELKDLEPVATIGSKKYYDLPTAFAAAQAGETLEIVQAGEYKIPGLPNITVSGKVDGVVFNCVGSGSIASLANGATFKNVTMNFGQSCYHGFQGAGHIVMEKCTLNGLFFSYGNMTFNECIFNQEEEEYNMWTYAGHITYDGCTFNSKGKFLNIYRESPIEYEVVAKDCVFNTSKANKAALNIKETCGANFLKYNVTITNCSCNDTQNTLKNKDDGTLYRVSPIWQVDDRKTGETGINVTIDGSKVYPFCSKDADGNYHIINADGLLQFHDLYAAGKVAYTAKVYLDNDIDFTGKTWTALDWHADGALKGFALFDGQNHTIKNFTVSGQGMFSRWACTANIGATPYFKDIVFDGAKNVESAINVSLFCGQTYQNAKIENVTIKNSQFEGNYKVAPFVGSVYDDGEGKDPTLTLKDCKVENTTVRGTSSDYDICGMVAWVNEKNNDKVAFEGNNVVKDVTLYIPAVTRNMCAKIYHNGETAYDEAANVTVNNVNVVIAQ